MVKAKNSGNVSTLRDAGLEAFVTTEMNRAELKQAPYNPRILSDQQRRKLKAGLKRHGLVSPVTWNRHTGNIVGGHQRLSVLDSIMGTSDYRLTVAVIDVPESKEKELNILLNNSSAMGDWDIEKLTGMLRDGDVDLAGTGFEASDIFAMLGGDVDENSISQGDIEAAEERYRLIRDQYDKIRGGNKEKNDTSYYMVVIFRDNADLVDFVASAKLPDNRYQSGQDIRALCALQKD